jgi:hypothetical protein
MSSRDAPSEDSTKRDTRSEVTTRLHGYRLVLLRLICLSLYVLSVGLLVASIPSYLAYLHLLCTGTATACNATGQLAPGDVRRLQELGLSIDFYATYNIVITLIFALGYWLVAALLFWRKSDNPLALLAAVSLGIFPLAFNTNFISILPSPWLLLGYCISFLGDLCIILFFYVFPGGHFVPRWTRWVLIPAIAYWGITVFFPQASFNPFFRFPVLNFVTFLVVVGGVVGVQVYRYRHVSTLTQRQQTKWVVFGVSIGVGGFLVLNLLVLLFPALFPAGSLVSLIGTTLIYGLMLLIPLSIGFAVLRSRLWDIDVIINRTLVYGTLTATLALVYVGLVIALQFLLRGLISQTSDIAIVASTLAIYVLFNPLRHRIQQVIDRRFYRRKYDAARTLAAFSATLRNEVDLDQLREALVAVVEETMQPSHVSLWLRPPQQDTKPQTTWISTPLIANISAQDGEDLLPPDFAY